MWFSKETWSGVKEERTGKGSEGRRRERGRIVWNIKWNILICQIRETQISFDLWKVWSVFLLEWKCLAVWAFCIIKKTIGFLFMLQPYLLSSKVLLFWYEVLNVMTTYDLHRSWVESSGWYVHSHLCSLRHNYLYSGSLYISCVNDVVSLSDTMITAFDTDFPKYGISFLTNVLPSSFLPLSSILFWLWG